MDLVGPAFIEFNSDGMAAFQFIAVQGRIDFRVGERGGRPAVEFSWWEQDDADASVGRGWAILRGAKLGGRWFFHLGDDARFLATKASHSAPKGPAARAPHRGR